MKNTFLLHFTFFLFITFTAGAQGIQFEKSNWAAVQAKAKAENKYIFVDTYATWCRPCKWLDKKVFPQKQVGDFFNEHYVSFKLNVEKGEGVAFAKKYHALTLPTLLYFNSQGELVHKSIGIKRSDYNGEQEAKALIKEANDVLNPDKQAYTMQRRFEKGERDNTFLEKCIQALSSASEDFSKPTAIYLRQLGKNHWTTAEGWKFISKYGTQFSSEVFEYVIRNRSKFEKVAKSKEEVDKYIYETVGLDVFKVGNARDKTQLATFKSKLKDLLAEKANKHIARTEYMFYFWDKEKSEQYTNKYFDKYCDDYSDFFMVTGLYLSIYNDSKRLEKAVTWCKKSIALAKRPGNTNRLADLLFKLQHYQKAKKAALEAMALAKKEKNIGLIGENKVLLEKIKAKL